MLLVNTIHDFAPQDLTDLFQPVAANGWASASLIGGIWRTHDSADEHCAIGSRRFAVSTPTVSHRSRPTYSVKTSVVRLISH